MDLFKGDLVTVVVVGVGAALLSPIVVPLVREVVRPAAKAVIKGGMVLYDQGRVAVAEVGEMADDMVAEARSELAEIEAETHRATDGQGGVRRPARRRQAARKGRTARKAARK